MGTKFETFPHERLPGAALSLPAEAIETAAYSRRVDGFGTNPFPMSKKIFIVEPHPVHRESYTFLIDRQIDLAISGVVASMDQAERALEVVTPDLIALTLTPPAVDNGLQRMQALRDAHPSLPILVVSACDATVCADAVLQAGAQAYLPRERVPFDLISSIRQILATASSARSSFSAAA